MLPSPNLPPLPRGRRRRRLPAPVHTPPPTPLPVVPPRPDPPMNPTARPTPTLTARSQPDPPMNPNATQRPTPASHPQPTNPTATPVPTPTPTPVAHPQPDPPMPTAWYRDAPRCGMDLPSGVGPSREIKADGNPGHSFTSFSGHVVESLRNMANDLYVAAKGSLFDHFQEMIAEEITKLLCPQYGGSISQELADVPEYIGAQGSPTSAEMSMDRTPPYFSQMFAEEADIPAGMTTDRTTGPSEKGSDETTGPSEKGSDETSSPARMKNNSPCLALIWQNESHVTIIKLAVDPSKQMGDFVSGNDNGRFGTCYIAPVKSIQEASKSEILENLNVNSDFNKQKGWEPPSSSDAPKESRSYNLKRKRPIDQASPTNVGAFPTSSMKKKRRGSVSCQKVKPSLIMDMVTRVEDLSDAVNSKSQQDLKLVSSSDAPRESRSYNLKRKRPIDQASPTNVGAFPTSPMKKKRRGNISSQNAKPSLIMGTVTRVKDLSDAVNSKSEQDSKLVSSSDSLQNEKEKRLVPCTRGSAKKRLVPCTRGSAKKRPIPCTRGSARTSIDGWEWLRWSHSSTQEYKERVRGWEWNAMKKSPHIDARAYRAKLRNLMAGARGSNFVKHMQTKGRTKQLRFSRSKIHGWGVVADEHISSEDFIVEYVGEVIRKKLSDIRELRYEKEGICDYLFKIDVDYVIDATKRGGIARYINHSCEPNCFTKVILANGQKKIFIYAKKPIMAGEELTYNYRFPLNEKKIPCLCGSKKCHGFMN